MSDRFIFLNQSVIRTGLLKDSKATVLYLWLLFNSYHKRFGKNDSFFLRTNFSLLSSRLGMSRPTTKLKLELLKQLNLVKIKAVGHDIEIFTFNVLSNFTPENISSAPILQQLYSGDTASVKPLYSKCKATLQHSDQKTENSLGEINNLKNDAQKYIPINTHIYNKETHIEDFSNFTVYTHKNNCTIMPEELTKPHPEPNPKIIEMLRLAKEKL